MSTVRLVPLLLLLVPSAAPAQSMNAETFNRRATALMKKGPLALFSRAEIKTLTQEGQAAGAKARDLRKAAIAAGGKPRFCPPGQSVSMNSDEFMKRLAEIPGAERERIDMTEATTRILARKFPCPAS